MHNVLTRPTYDRSPLSGILNRTAYKLTCACIGLKRLLAEAATFDVIDASCEKVQLQCVNGNWIIYGSYPVLVYDPTCNSL